MKNTEAGAFEAAALRCCERLLDSALAKRFPESDVKGLAIIAFTLGAAWALNEQPLIDLANAQMDAARASREGRMS
jgi:hypothetical protein